MEPNLVSREMIFANVLLNYKTLTQYLLLGLDFKGASRVQHYQIPRWTPQTS